MHYYELEPECNDFHTLLVDVTHRCPMACANCYIPNRDIPDMDVSKLYEFLAKLPNRTDIRLIGAEPTMRNDLPEIIKEVRRLGHRPSILTGGLRMKNPDYVNKLWDAGLRSLGLSMNGADDNAIYEIMDGKPRYAYPKVEALKNCFKRGMVVHVNCIIARGVNEHLIGYLPELVTFYAQEAGRKFGKKYPIMVRFKNIGQIGRYMDDDKILTMEELALLCEEQLGVNSKEILKKNFVDGYNECTSSIFEYETENGNLLIKLTDWEISDDGVPDPGSRRRGRVTPDFKVAPFFEHVKMNENDY